MKFSNKFSCPGTKYNGDEPTFMFEVVIFCSDLSSERKAEANNGSRFKERAICTGREGPFILIREMMRSLI